MCNVSCVLNHISRVLICMQLLWICNSRLYTLQATFSKPTVFLKVNVFRLWFFNINVPNAHSIYAKHFTKWVLKDKKEKYWQRLNICCINMTGVVCTYNVSLT